MIFVAVQFFNFTVFEVKVSADESELLIADEPTTALDVTVQAEILRLMKELQQRKGTAILFITHDFGVVSQMADRLAVMQLGKIVESGPLQQMINAPQHPYTQKLLAALPENLPRETITHDSEHSKAAKPLLPGLFCASYNPNSSGAFRLSGRAPHSSRVTIGRRGGGAFRKGPDVSKLMK